MVSIATIATNVPSNGGIYYYGVMAKDSLTGVWNDDSKFSITADYPNTAVELRLMWGTDIKTQQYQVSSAMI
jgi:hypothetical protein